MSKDRTRKGTEEQKESPQGPQRWSGTDYEICLHCSNPFHISDGVVTPDAAFCDICIGS